MTRAKQPEPGVLAGAAIETSTGESPALGTGGSGTADEVRGELSLNGRSEAGRDDLTNRKNPPHRLAVGTIYRDVRVDWRPARRLVTFVEGG